MNEPAFPRDHAHDGHNGMSLRDYFAAQSMIGLCHFWVAVNSKATINDPDPKIIARMAYDYADAMLGARTVGVRVPAGGQPE